VTALAAVHGIVVRDLSRSLRQRGRLVGGLARPFMWLLLVGAGYGAIARVEGAASYQAFIFPGVVVMATLFGATLTAISTVYDREFGMLRLMLSSPAGLAAVLAGRAVAATTIGLAQGGIVLITMPLFVPVNVSDLAAALGALVLGAAAFSTIGLLVAAPLRSVENFAGVINVLLFPLLFLSGALYPTAGLAGPLRILARANPVTYAVDLVRAALAQPTEFGPVRSALVLVGVMLLGFAATLLLFDPEHRVALRARGGRP
jgi:ABC-2 type transport system permease protein